MIRDTSNLDPRIQQRIKEIANAAPALTPQQRVALEELLADDGASE